MKEFQKKMIKKREEIEAEAEFKEKQVNDQKYNAKRGFPTAYKSIKSVETNDSTDPKLKNMENYNPEVNGGSVCFFTTSNPQYIYDTMKLLISSNRELKQSEEKFKIQS